MADRYFVENPITGDKASLSGPEAHHLINVMRTRPGVRVVLFDGSGAEFSARVETIGRNCVELVVLGREEVDRELPFGLTLGVALPKGQRQKWLVEKAVELGVGKIVPIKTARAVAQPMPQALQRLRHAVIEASKQCGRNRLLEIADPLAWDDFVAQTCQEPFRLLAHPRDAQPGIKIFAAEQLPERMFLAVGPEGGFTDEEAALAVEAGWRTVNLGPRILRVESAALVLATLVITSYRFSSSS